ncbi:MAG: HAMP domain-containing protein [Bacteroidetes bacterium]|nr:MAG: HAMP domain-containing protein [Bacteroidota bacterium]
MTRFRDSRIQRKLNIVILAVSSISILLTCAGFAAYEMLTYRQRLVDDLMSKSEIIGATSTAALAFNNNEDATEILSSLSMSPRILTGAIYTNDEKLFASFVREPAIDSPPSLPPSDGFNFALDRLRVSMPVKLNNARIGTVILESNLEGLQSKLGSYGIIVALVLFLSFSATAFISSRMQRRISDPILELAQVARHVSENKDYSIRAEKKSNDELGTLAETFNEMLIQIQLRELSLKRAYETLSQEITERKQSEEAQRLAEKRFKTTLDHLLEGCQIIGFHWEYLYLNDVAVEHSHKSKEELLGSTMMESYPGIESTEIFSRLKRCMEERIPCVVDNEFIYPDGSKRWFHLNIEPVPEGIFVLTVDITKEQELNEKLKEYREHLEDLVKERTAQLETANKELEAFSYSVSHDLRAPLRHIDGFSELLLKHTAELIDEKGKRYLNIISTSAKEMGALIDELLVFSRMGRVEMRASKVNLNIIVNDTIASLNHEIQERIIHWNVEQLPIVEADPSMIRLVYQNLIANAIKFTRNEQRAEITIGCSPNQDEHILYVKDNGVGFDMQYSDKLFGVFQRLHRADEFEGTGIGLANVRRIINRHNGRTWAKGEPKNGATIYFSLPKEKKG